MASLGYAFVAQDRSKTKFTITNITLFRMCKLQHRWTDSRSRALITGFVVLSNEAPAASAVSGATSEVSSSAQVKTAGAVANNSTVDNGAVGEKDEVATGVPSLAGWPNIAAESRSHADKDEAQEGAARLAGGAKVGEQMVYIGNVHLEGHPYKAKERLAQVQSVMVRLQGHVARWGHGYDDARIAIVGVSTSPEHFLLAACHGKWKTRCRVIGSILDVLQKVS
jgi:hypothetical protein